MPSQILSYSGRQTYVAEIDDVCSTVDSLLLVFGVWVTHPFPDLGKLITFRDLFRTAVTSCIWWNASPNVCVCVCVCVCLREYIVGVGEPPFSHPRSTELLLTLL